MPTLAHGIFRYRQSTSQFANHSAICTQMNDHALRCTQRFVLKPHTLRFAIALTAGISLAE